MNKDNLEKRGNPGLEDLRKRAKLNKTKMAKGCGVTSRMYQLYANEGWLPDKVETLIRIAVLSETPIDEVIKMIGYPIPSKDELLSQIESAHG